MNESSFWAFIANADIIVKFVIIILLCASIASWTMIIQRALILRKTKRAARSFEKRFWSGEELDEEDIEAYEQEGGLGKIFHAGFTEFTKLRKKDNMEAAAIMKNTERAMSIEQERELGALENNISFLATVGSTAPYVGLFGTVWGIMTAFRALGSVQQASISMVAPGISEALIATAIGLFAAIPAVIAYNRFTSNIENIAHTFELFQEKLTNVFHRQVHNARNMYEKKV